MQTDPATQIDPQAVPVVADATPHSQIADGFGEVVKRITDGDFSADTWILMWQTIGQPVLLALVLIVAVLLGAGWVRKITAKACRRAKVEETLARFLANLAKYAVLFAGGVAILGTLGIETASFAAALAAVGFAIGMALSGTLGNVAAGVMLLFFRPFKVGDAVNAAGVTGKIYEINLFNTSFDTFDNRRIIVPNSDLFNKNIENITFHPTRRVDVNVGTEYKADLDKTREVLKRVAESVEGGLKDPAPAVVLLELGGSSINWVVRVWVNTPDFWDVKDRLTRNIKVALDEAKIGIPFPQMDVHLDGVLKRLAEKDD
jgi:small conductance mechanosensitive channel